MVTLEEKYFEVLTDFFNEAFKIAEKENFNRAKYSLILGEIYDPITAKSLIASLYDELKSLDWNSQMKQVKGIGGLKTAYVGSGYNYLGEISSTESFLRKTGLYSDTILIKEQIFDTLSSGGEKNNVPLCVFDGTIHTAINFLKMEELFTSDSNPHICTLVPAFVGVTNDRSTYNQLRKNEIVMFSSELFDKQFNSIEELNKFILSIKTPSQFFRLMRKPELMARPTGEPSSMSDFKEMQEKFQMSVGPHYNSAEFYAHLLTVHSLNLVGELYNYSNYRPNLATDFTGVWRRLLWLIQKDNENILNLQKKPKITKEELVISSLQQENLKWLGNVPIDKLAELRERGELSDLRAIIGSNIENIETASDEDFIDVAEKVKDNINTALRKHDAEIKYLNEKFRKRYKINLASIAVSGTLGFASALYPPLAYFAALVGGETIYDIAKTYSEKREELTELKRRPVALLFDARKSSE